MGSRLLLVCAFSWVPALACFPHVDGVAPDEPKGPGEQLRSRAAFDLNCPEASLRAVDLGNNTRGVSGCGRRATYLYVCRGTYQSDCTWVMNSDSKSENDDGLAGLRRDTLGRV